MMFADRTAAGEALAGKVLHLKGPDTIVLALPRGGLPVGLAVAEALEAPLDVILVRKIGAPYQPELAIGAVVDGGSPMLVLNSEVLAHLSLPANYLEEEKQRQLEEIERRRALYCKGRPPPGIKDKTVIIVDDGIATGATAKAAVKAIRSAGAKRIVLAVPVLPASLLDAWKALVDELVFVEAPDLFRAVGFFYANFSQTTDEDVADILHQASERRAETHEPAA